MNFELMNGISVWEVCVEFGMRNMICEFCCLCCDNKVSLFIVNIILMNVIMWLIF